MYDKQLELLTAAVERARRRGWRIQTGCWILNPTRTCCPIGAALIDHRYQVALTGSCLAAAALLLGMHINTVSLVIDYVDSRFPNDGTPESELAVALRDMCDPEL